MEDLWPEPPSLLDSSLSKVRIGVTLTHRHMGLKAAPISSFCLELEATIHYRMLEVPQNCWLPLI
jgi:hypothetical protein